MKKRTLIVRGREAYSTDTRLVQGTAGQDCVALELDEEWRGLDVLVAFEHESGERRTPREKPRRHLHDSVGVHDEGGRGCAR